MRHLTIFPAIPEASNSLDRYLSELKNIPLITAEEEIRLARRIRAGDEQALEQLVRANLRFVVSVAKQYQNTYIPLMDLISEGNIGLVEAARRFDETKGFNPKNS
jgi:RNA polymerase primary sigma factor